MVNASCVFHVLVTVIPVCEHLATVLALITIAGVLLGAADARTSY